MDQVIAGGLLKSGIVDFLPHPQVFDGSVAPHPALYKITGDGGLFLLCDFRHGDIGGTLTCPARIFSPSVEGRKPWIFFVSNCSNSFSENSSTSAWVISPFFIARRKTVSVDIS